MPDDGKQGTPAGADKVEALQAQILVLTEKISKLGENMNSGLTGLRSMYDQRLQRLQNDLRQARGDGGSYDRPYTRDTGDPDQGNRDTRETDPFAETDRFERARDRFERNHKDYSTDPEIKKRVDAIMGDKSKRDAILVELGGRYDYERTYRTAYLEAKNQIAEEAKIAADQARTQADEEKRNAKTDAVLSGDSVEELPEGLTLESIMGMSPEEMETKGLVPGVKKHKPLVGV